MFKELLKRFYDLLMKLISVKGVFAILMTILALKNYLPGYFSFLAWLFFIIGREAFKLLKAEECAPKE